MPARWKMEGIFADGAHGYALDKTEQGAVESLAKMQDEHGALEWYGGYNGGGYIDGEYCGEE